MGWNTYHQIVTELSPDEWVYDDFTTYVVTHKKKFFYKIRFVNENPIELIRELQEENGKGIWICSGANIIQQLVREDIIDCYYITVVPTILGSGIRLFEITRYVERQSPRKAMLSRWLGQNAEYQNQKRIY